MVISINLTEFTPAITVGITITEHERKLLSLAPRLGGLGISIFEEDEIEYQNSTMISELFAIALLINLRDMNQMLN